MPGMAQHALPLKLVGDAMFIRNRVLQRLARIELENDAALRARLGRFVVIGGGFSGVEVAGELADFLRGARRFYPRVRADELKVTVVHDGERLLPELPATLGRAAEKSLMSRGLDVRLEARAARISADGVLLADGEFLPAATVVCTIGSQANALVAALGPAVIVLPVWFRLCRLRHWHNGAATSPARRCPTNGCRHPQPGTWSSSLKRPLQRHP